jgi:hypothetical protein
VFFLSVTVILYSLTCTDNSNTTRQTVRVETILIMVFGVVVWCGVRLNKVIARLKCHTETWFLSVIYIMEKNSSYHFSVHIHVTMLALPGEEMTDIWNKCIEGIFTNCDISKTINKTNCYNLFFFLDFGDCLNFK